MPVGASVARPCFAAGGLLAITADHGNAEEKLDSRRQSAYRAHDQPRTAPADRARNSTERFARGGKLGDVAPTLLAIMGLPVPERMSGTNLFVRSAGAMDPSRPLSG